MLSTVILPGTTYSRTALATLLAVAFTAVAVASDDRDLATLIKLEGRVVDDASGVAVPYVNVGIPGAAIGSVGREDGRFELAGVSGDAIVLFSAIGYAPRSVPVNLFPADGEIRLVPVEIGFTETVSVTARAKGEPQVLGNRYKQERGYGFGFGSGLLGAELGALIRIKRPTFVESANFMIAHTGGEQFLYRINIYDHANGKIGKNLLTRNVIIAAKQERGTMTVDLREHGLVVEHDVLLALEWIRDDKDVGNANVMFRAKPRTRANLYHKLTSQMPFLKLRRHSLGFYLLGYSLD